MLCWIKVVVILDLFQGLVGIFLGFHHWVLHWLWFVINNFPLYTPLERVFIMNGCWILSDAFSTSIEMIIWFLAFLLLLWLISHWFVYVEPSLWPWGESNLTTVYDLFHMLLDSVCEYFVEDFCIYVHQRYWPVIFFFGSVVVWF